MYLFLGLQPTVGGMRRKGGEAASVSPVTNLDAN
jgi:hypothetical protein